LINIFIFDKPFGMSTSISLNSFMNGGNTRIKIVNTITDITVNTKNKERDRGIFNPFAFDYINYIQYLKLLKNKLLTGENLLKSILLSR